MRTDEIDFLQKEIKAYSIAIAECELDIEYYENEIRRCSEELNNLQEK